MPEAVSVLAAFIASDNVRTPSVEVVLAVTLLSDIVTEFYSCPECGKTAVPHEAMFMQQVMNAYAWRQAVAMELF